MPNPTITCLLCTVRSDHAFKNHPDWLLFQHVKDELEKQTYQDFELIVVDGLQDKRSFPDCTFPVKHIKPLENLWTRNRKVAISTYRNTGIIYADGAIIVNLDDTFSIPERWLELYAKLYKEGRFGAATWRHNGDTRLLPNQSLRRANRGEVYGFGSYPLDAALNLNGYDLSFDGSMYLEDIEWGVRLFDAGVKQDLFWMNGFCLEEQTPHSLEAISKKEPIVKCCNPAYQMAKVVRNQTVANKAELWTREHIQKLLAPCAWLTKDDKCMHHNGMVTCAYLKSSTFEVDGTAHSFAKETHPIAMQMFDEPPVTDLKQLRSMRLAGEL